MFTKAEKSKFAGAVEAVPVENDSVWVSKAESVGGSCCKCYHWPPEISRDCSFVSWRGSEPDQCDRDELAEQ